MKMERYQRFFAEQIKQKREEISEGGWINGIYIGRAIGGCFSKRGKYPNEPLKFWSNDQSEKESKEAFTDADRFAGFAAAYNKVLNDSDTKFERRERHEIGGDGFGRDKQIGIDRKASDG